MMDAGAVADRASDLITGVLSQIGDLVQATGIPEQIQDVDAGALFANPWFLVPFVLFIGYELYKQAFRDIIIVALIIGVWWVSGTDYMQTLVVGDELQISKVLPVLFGGATVLGVIIYLLFGRS
ncbi:hypothetical protein [Desulfolithobacter sp.]